MTYTVFIDDNYHYMDKDARYTNGEFETLEAAVGAAKRIIDDVLHHEHHAGMNAADLYGRYKMFGEDSWVSSQQETPFFGVGLCQGAIRDHLLQHRRMKTLSSFSDRHVLRLGKDEARNVAGSY